MFFKKKGKPEKGELVVCTIKKILPHAAFVYIDEYDNLEAMLHVSEISTKWVNDIKEHISKGKRVVCKVLEIKPNGHIDVSLKRVSSGESKRKMDELKSERRIEKLIEAIAKKFNAEPKKSLEKIGGEIVKDYGSLYSFYYELKEEGPELIKELDIPKKWIDELFSKISEQLEAQKIKIFREFNLKCLESDGIERIKKIFNEMKKIASKNKFEISIRYISAPKYVVDVIAKNYKDAEIFVSKLFEKTREIAEKQKVEFSLPGDLNE